VSGKTTQRFVCALTFVVVAVDCGSPAPAPRELVPVTQAIGSWTGAGNHTIGLVSNSGRFRVQWDARADSGTADGVFRLTVNSAVSGRLLQEVVNQQGPGRGSLNFEDDPRPYNLMVESSGLQWTVSVDEVVLVPPPS
jgi:hypothetical protein